MRRFFLTLFILTFVFLYGDIDKDIRHADTYYWLGIGEHGDMAAFAKALDYLEKAEIDLKNVELPEPEKEYIKQQISTLRSDVLYQQDMAHDTFLGVFPLNRIIGNTIFSDAGAFGTFELIDDPDIIVVCNGVEKLVETLNRSLKYSPQYGVVINSNPPNQALENEVRYIFNLDDRFFVHTYQEIASSLTEDELKAFEINEIDSDLVTHLCNLMNNPYLVLVTIRQVDVVDGVYFFILEAEIYWDNEGAPKFKMAEMSFCRDRRDAFIPLWVTNIILFGLTLLVFLFFNKHKRGGKSMARYWVMPVLAFFWGRLLPWVLNPLLVSFRPEPETLIKLSFWWPIIYGLVLICGTMLTWYLVSKRASKIVKILAPEGWTDLALISVGLGLAAFLGETILIYNTSMILAVIEITLIITAIGYVLGSILDCTRKSAGWFIVPVLIIAGLSGLIILRMIKSEIMFLSLISLAVAVIAYFRMKKNLISYQYETDKKPVDPSLELIPDLAEMIVKPQYQKFIAFQQAYEKVGEFITGKSSIILIIGPSGRGKTATAEALIEEIKTKTSCDLLVLRGECPNQEAHLSPYMPLQQALGHISGINFSSVNKDNSNIDSIFDSLMDSVIPFSSLLLPGDEAANGLQSREQLNSLIFSSLVKMCKKSRVILFIDDLQWIDDATKDFLNYLNDRLNENNKLPLLLLFTSRTQESSAEIGLKPENIVELNPLQDSEKEMILNKGLGFEEGLCHDLLKSFGNIASKQGEMFFLLSTLGELAREVAFKKGDFGYVLSEKYKTVDQLPIPDSFADSVMEQLQRISKERMIVECAACSGLEFKVEVLVKSLEMSRLELLCSLNRIETETDIIYDVGEFDDIYAFRSSAVLEVIRNNLKIYNYGPLNPKVPQIIREYHSRLADVLENKKGSSVFDIAGHYYAAGKLYADKAIEYCIKSTHSAAGLFQHDNACRYLEMAKECAEVSGRVHELESEFLQLEITESLVENSRQEEIADKAWKYLEGHNEIRDSLKLLISKSFYNAGLASGNQKYFKKAVETASVLANTGDDQFIQAESKQIIAISLDRNRKDEIIDNLESAYSSLLKLSENSMRTRELRSRIENSLAERLTYGNSDKKQHAEELFLHSITIKEELLDKPGLARSWGGLGRLYLEMNKIPEARECFEKDIELCHQIGDKGGEVKMYSFIADCYGRVGDYNNARKSYEDSYHLADNLNDRLFAARGLIIVGIKSQTTEDLKEYGKFLFENHNAALGIWSGFFDEIKESVKGKEILPRWLKEIEAVIKD